MPVVVHRKLLSSVILGADQHPRFLRTLIREHGDDHEMAQKNLTLAGSQPIEVGLAASTLGMATSASGVAASTPTLSTSIRSFASQLIRKAVR
jgi:hypothetical protein